MNEPSSTGLDYELIDVMIGAYGTFLTNHVLFGRSCGFVVVDDEAGAAAQTLHLNFTRTTQ